VAVTGCRLGLGIEEPDGLIGHSRTRIPMDRVHGDDPPLRPSATRQAAKGQALRLEVQDHVMTTQPTGGFPHPTEGEAHVRDCTNAGRHALH
jgi:hypothetical protein